MAAIERREVHGYPITSCVRTYDYIYWIHSFGSYDMWEYVSAPMCAHECVQTCLSE